MTPAESCGRDGVSVTFRPPRVLKSTMARPFRRAILKTPSVLTLGFHYVDPTCTALRLGETKVAKTGGGAGGEEEEEASDDLVSL